MTDIFAFVGDWILSHPIEIVGSFAVALALAALAWVASRLAWVKQRPAVASTMWAIATLKFVLPIGVGFSVGTAAGVGTELRLDADVVIATAHTGGGVSWVARLVGLLAIGFGLIAIVRVALRVRAARVLATQISVLPVAPSVVMVQARLLAAKLGVRRTVAVRYGDNASAFCFGVIRPVIVLPQAALAEEFAEQRTAALAHELAHIARFDALWSQLGQLCVDLLWWVPVVKYVNQQWSQAREHSCDALALQITTCGPARYAAALVWFARQAQVDFGVAMARHALIGRVSALAAAANGQHYAGKVGISGALVLVPFAALFVATIQRADAAVEPDCRYSEEIAQSMFAKYPQADANSDGQLSRGEVCDFQLRFANSVVASPDQLVSELDPQTTQFLDSICDPGNVTSQPNNATCVQGE